MRGHKTFDEKKMDEFISMLLKSENWRPNLGIIGRALDVKTSTIHDTYQRLMKTGKIQVNITELSDIELRKRRKEETKNGHRQAE